MLGLVSPNESRKAPQMEAQALLQLAILIDTYPGVNGDVCVGGAETNLERVVNFISDQHGGELRSMVYIRRGTIDPVEPSVQQLSSGAAVVRPRSLWGLTSFLIRNQSSFHAFYCADKTLYFRPHLFLRMLRGFRRPILLRITSSKYLDFLRLIPAWMRQMACRLVLKGRRDIYVIALSQDCHDGLRALKIPDEFIVPLPNSVDLLKYQPPQDPQSSRTLRMNLFPDMSAEGCVFVYVGRIIGWHKRVDLLLEAWSRSGLQEKGHRLLVVGAPKKDVFITDGYKIWEKHGPLDGRSGPGKMKGTFWTGLVSMQQLPSYLWMSDVFVLPSDFEGMSNAAIEALASGLPVIGRRGVSGNAELIDPQITGLLFEDLPQLIQQLQWMAQPENRRGMREAALKKAQGFSVESMCKRYVDLFKRMLPGRDSNPRQGG